MEELYDNSVHPRSKEVYEYFFEGFAENYTDKVIELMEQADIFVESFVDSDGDRMYGVLYSGKPNEIHADIRTLNYSILRSLESFFGCPFWPELISRATSSLISALGRAENSNEDEDEECLSDCCKDCAREQD